MQSEIGSLSDPYLSPKSPRASSYASVTTGCTNFYQKCRWRTDSKTALRFLSDGSGCGRRQSFREDVGRAASGTYQMTRLGSSLFLYLGLGYRWIAILLALCFYAFLLLPGFVQVGFYYFFSSRIRRGIVYGDQPRNRLDLYLPKHIDGPKPVVAFVTGGAWFIGNFPKGTISDMVKDASEGISFVCNHISDYRGDPNRVYLMGQSAGAHISACALLE